MPITAQVFERDFLQWVANSQVRTTDQALKPAAHQRAATFLVDRYRAAPKSRQQAKVAAGVKSTAAGRVLLANTKAYPFVVGAHMGAKRWRQFPRWVGNQWEEGEAPLVIGPTAKMSRPALEAIYSEAIMEILGGGGNRGE